MLSDYVSPKRVQRQRAKGWRMPEGCVYVGRPTKWGNPFRLCEEWPTHDEVIRMYRDLIDHGEAWWLSHPGTRWEQRNRWRVHPSQRNWLDAAVIRRELAGRDLMCWCPLDVPCHADVLLELANGDQ